MAAVREDLSLACGRVVDVALLSDSGVVLAIKVSVHDRDRLSEGSNADVTWLVLSATRIVADPLVLQSVQAEPDGYVCEACRDRRSVELREVRDLLKQQGASLPPDPPYWPAATYCFRCRKRIVVYTWKGREPWDKRPPPPPAPNSIRWRRSEQVESGYWANTCSYCQVTLGDFFLLEPSGPLPHLK